MKIYEKALNLLCDIEKIFLSGKSNKCKNLTIAFSQRSTTDIRIRFHRVQAYRTARYRDDCQNAI